ncbi:Rho guanine nucleotide exchange factor scd1 and CDC24-like protein [Rozella allomycis CSF55]|uniref:Rho guanine nucleotide exchange factor scd1 and CDC24-like protein n=1 Tax=Rozella allomycis (strain CSF55) TaxID=988480 RepID=A0A075AYD9_ROZAC|nr:Rho guanine nucleotide exchange factor scd1 and CDC24-like protein [Rozella allomycis CSF55]|eukprot:EPZ33727.1 Rho guanine nucleotide exchange factor scd1 and CDC24-like protein [Rozella allomycis CSF55]
MTQSGKRHSVDPLQVLWSVFRQAGGLCMLMNILKPGSVASINEMPKNPCLEDLSNNLSKANMYHFLKICREDLKIPPSALFSISEAYMDDTNCFMKVLQTVEVVLDIMEGKQLLPKNSARLSMERSKESLFPKELIGDLELRARVITELIETERKYVSDLEILQKYRENAERLITEEENIKIFSNLNELLDFQRRFLISLESMLQVPLKDQTFGQIFVYMKSGFSVYETYCATHKVASETVLEIKEKLKPISHILDPVIQIPSYLIKPIQRVCKYPLLLRELLKGTPESHDDHKWIEEAVEVSKEIAEKVNENHRQQENIAIVADIEKRVEDWKGHEIGQFGELLLEDKLLIVVNGNQKDLLIIVILKQTQPSLIRRKSKNLQLKGHIYLKAIDSIVNCSKDGTFALKVYWQDESELASFQLIFRMEEQMNMWHSTLIRLLNKRHSSTSTMPHNSFRFSTTTTSRDFTSRPLSQSKSVDGLSKVSENATPPNIPLPENPSISRSQSSPDNEWKKITPQALRKKRESNNHEDSGHSFTRSHSRNQSIEFHRKYMKDKQPQVDTNSFADEFDQLLLETQLPSPAFSPVEQVARKVKIYFETEMHLMYLSFPMSFQDLLARVVSKIGKDDVKIQFADDEGDRIMMTCDDDVESALSLSPNGTLNLYAIILLSGLMPPSFWTKLALIWVAKKAVVYGIARAYGFPRIYRKVLRLNRRFIKDPETRDKIQYIAKTMILFPNIIKQKYLKLRNKR